MPSLWFGLGAGFCTGLASGLVTLFGYLFTLAIIISGVVFVVAPLQAKPLLKNAAIALGLFLLGSVLLTALCAASSALKLLAQVLVCLLSSIAASAAALFLITASFVYLFNPGLATKWLKKFAVPFAGLLLLLAVVSPLANSHPLASCIALVLLSVGAYLVREGRLHRSTPQRSSGKAERTPVFPKGKEE
jgi:hypothetical protein